MSIEATIADAAALIAAEPAPVFFLDTCALLDILEVPLAEKSKRKRIHSTLITAARQALEASGDHPRRLWFVVQRIVYREYEKGCDGIETNLKQHLKALENQLIPIRAALEAFPELPRGGMPRSDLAAELPGALRNLADGIVDSAVLLANDGACMSRGWRRSDEGRAPAKRGDASRNDCDIIEHVLALSHELQARGVTDRRFFISSDADDYRMKGVADVDPSLVSDFEAAGLEYVQNLAQAWELFDHR